MKIIRGQLRSTLTVLFFISLIWKSAFCQNPTQCHYPSHVSADSLINIIIKKDIHYNCPSCEEYKKNFEGKIQGIKYDSALWKCQNYLIQHLGSSVYCNYVDMYLNSFNAPSNYFVLSFGLQLPNLKHKQRWGTKDCQYERVNIEFRFKLQKDSSISITYPTNVPDCNGLPDCGFVYTKEKAIEVAKNTGFLNDSSKYYMEPDGINWVIDLAEDKHGQTKTIKINIQTGKQSSIQIGQRID